MRVGNLFDRVTAFDNLLAAAAQAARGKKTQPRVAHFLFHLEKELLRLQAQLQQGEWWPAPFRRFEIREPKPRQISAPDFADRVVHHALCNLVGPHIDRRLIFDCWACRAGKGSHAAVRRAQSFSRKYPYFLKCDVRRYFDSIDHGVLKGLLRSLFKDRPLLALLERIIDRPPEGLAPGKGLPIGNLTSQHFANLYLGELDHELKERQRVQGYLRYMDDLLLFGASKPELWRLLAHTEEFLAGRLGLGLKPSATLLAPVGEGVPYLGFRIYPGLIRLDRHSLRRFRRRLRAREAAY